MAFDQKVVKVFLEKQLQLFPEKVAETEDEAVEFLEDCMAVVVKSKKEVEEYFEEEGLEDPESDSILDAAEVFAIGDGRYLIVEA